MKWSISKPRSPSPSTQMHVQLRKAFSLEPRGLSEASAQRGKEERSLFCFSKASASFFGASVRRRLSDSVRRFIESIQSSLIGRCEKRFHDDSHPTLHMPIMEENSDIISDILICWGQTCSQLWQPRQLAGRFSFGMLDTAIGAINPPPVILCSL